MSLSLLRRNVDREALWKAAGTGRQPINKTSFTFQKMNLNMSLSGLRIALKGSLDIPAKLVKYFPASLAWLISFITNSFVANKDHQHTFALINGSD